MLVSEELNNFIQKIKISDHIIMFYDTPEVKHNILYNYIKNGLERKKGVLYICSDESPQQIRKSMNSFGISVEEMEKKGELSIRNYDEFYIENGQAETLKILSRWKKAQEYYQKKGLGMRVAGETSCFFKNNLVRELMRYEYALHRILSIPMEAICVYDLNTIVRTGYTDVIMPLLRAHGNAIFMTKDGSIIIEPENVEDTDLEKLLEIDI